MHLRNKIQKLIEYVDDNSAPQNLLHDMMDEGYIEFIPSKDLIICKMWENCRDSIFNEKTVEYTLSEVGEKLLINLHYRAIKKAEREYQRIEEQKRDEKIEKFMQAKVFGQSVSFIMES